MVINCENLRRAAQRALPGFAFDYVDGGADNEQTLRHNREVFERWMFKPTVLKDASVRSLHTPLEMTY